MAKMTLTDQGTYDVAGTFPTTGTEEKGFGSDAVQGNALNLNIMSIKVEHKALLTTDPEPQKKKSDDENKRYEQGEVDHNGIEIPKWTLKGVVDVSDVSQLQDWGRLVHMVATKGYKTLGFDPTGVTEKADILNYSQYGSTEADGVASTVTSINVKLDLLTTEQTLRSGYKLAYTLVVWETK